MFTAFCDLDPVKTRQGQLSIRALRLSVPALELCGKNDWSPEAYVIRIILSRIVFSYFIIVIIFNLKEFTSI